MIQGNHRKPWKRQHPRNYCSVERSSQGETSSGITESKRITGCQTIDRGIKGSVGSRKVNDVRVLVSNCTNRVSHEGF